MTMLIKILKRTLLGLLGLLLLVAIGGRVYQVLAEARDLEQFPPPGELFSIEGNMMHIHCEGQGSPTVVFEQGLGSLNETWEHIFAEVSPQTRICYYDRVGNGYSEPTGRLTRAPEVARRLNKLLQAAGEDTDMILVAWSAGGVYVREYYRQFPELVRGMVLVDSSHEQQSIRMPSNGAVGGNTLFEIAQYLAPVGIVRLSGLVEAQTRGADLSDEQRARVIARYSTSHAVQTQLLDSDAFELDINSSTPPSSLGSLPLIVLSRGEPYITDENITADELDFELRSRGMWAELQEELAALSTDSWHIIATESGHGIHSDQPRLLVNAIKDIVATVRRH